MPYLIHKNGQQIGPLDEAEIQAKLNSGEFSPDDLGWMEGFETWLPLRNFFVISPPAPPVPVVAPALNNRVSNSIRKFLNEEQEPAVVQKVYAKIMELCTPSEEVAYIAVQKRPVVTVAPESVI